MYPHLPVAVTPRRHPSKLIPVLLLFLSSLSGCSSYQYLTLDSPNLPKNERKEFVWESDSLKLIYNFHGQGGPINLTVFNKTDQPLYVNWKKSALIQGDQSVSLFNRTVEFNGQSSGIGYSIARNVSVTQSSFSGSFNLPEGADFIPPHTNINKAFPNVQTGEVMDEAETEGLATQKITDHDGVISRVKRAEFSEPGSPVRFACYLTFILGMNASQEFAVRNSFYAREMLQTHDSPESFSLYGMDGDKFYTVQHINW